MTSVTDLLAVIGGGAGLSAALTPVVGVVLARMQRRESDATAQVTEAEAADRLLRTYTEQVLGPLEARASRAETAAATTASEVSRLAARLAAIEAAQARHQAWDERVVRDLHAAGVSVDPPPPLVPSGP